MEQLPGKADTANASDDPEEEVRPFDRSALRATLDAAAKAAAMSVTPFADMRGVPDQGPPAPAQEADDSEFPMARFRRPGSIADPAAPATPAHDVSAHDVSATSEPPAAGTPGGVEQMAVDRRGADRRGAEEAGEQVVPAGPPARRTRPLPPLTPRPPHLGPLNSAKPRLPLEIQPLPGISGESSHRNSSEEVSAYDAHAPTMALPSMSGPVLLQLSTPGLATPAESPSSLIPPTTPALGAAGSSTASPRGGDQEQMPIAAAGHLLADAPAPTAEVAVAPVAWTPGDDDILPARRLGRRHFRLTRR